jgi:hypothetical protein
VTEGKITLLYDNHGIKLWKHEEADEKMFFLSVRGGEQAIFTENGFHNFVQTIARIEAGEKK